MPIFYMAVGLPASGKSSFGKKISCNKSRSIEIVSSDAIRVEVFGDINDQSHNQKVFEEMYQRSVKALAANKDVYYDACNISAKKRRNFIKNILRDKRIADKDIRFVCCVFCIPIEKCFENNENRDRVVPKYVIKKMLYNFQPPHYSEGWNRILLYNYCDYSGQYFSSLIDSNNIPHDNPRHELSVGEHMRKARKLYDEDKSINKNRAVADAILYHDIGKSYCKVFKNARREDSEVAHYYNHENVGAYLFLSALSGHNRIANDYLLDVANLIAHHMDFFKGETYLNKVKINYGEDFFKKLEVVHKFDVLAH